MHWCRILQILTINLVLQNTSKRTISQLKFRKFSGEWSSPRWPHLTLRRLWRFDPRAKR